jgi:hypothetical protein
MSGRASAVALGHMTATVVLLIAPIAIGYWASRRLTAKREGYEPVRWPIAVGAAFSAFILLGQCAPHRADASPRIEAAAVLQKAEAIEHEQRIVEAFLSAGPSATKVPGVSPALNYLADGNPIDAARFWRTLQTCQWTHTGLILLDQGSRSRGERIAASFACTNYSDPSAMFEFKSGQMVTAEISHPMPTLTVAPKQ